jgi:hypothetical protein
VVSLEWSTPSACAKNASQDPPADTPPVDNNTPSGSGIGWFFLLFVSSVPSVYPPIMLTITLDSSSLWELISLLGLIIIIQTTERQDGILYRQLLSFPQRSTIDITPQASRLLARRSLLIA